MKNKKAIFITLIAIFIVAIFLIIGYVALKNERTGYKINIIKNKFMMHDSFVDRLTEKNIPLTVKQSIKYSLKEISELVISGTFNKSKINLSANLTEIIKTGNLSNHIILNPTFEERIELIHRLSYLRDIHYNISLINLTINQTDYKTIEVDFWINYTVNFTNSNYNKLFNKKEDIFIFGFKADQGLIKNTWIENNTNYSCYLGELSSIYNCGSATQILPP